ncbi:hypothetical protein Pse7367_3953 (plasmid) [Thalassoporum mexicanum PCC 7367]|nr:hypothetical protein Pse7367_3953 [Pseudanabaena sp. PCC 7367]
MTATGAIAHSLVEFLRLPDWLIEILSPSERGGDF